MASRIRSVLIVLLLLMAGCTVTHERLVKNVSRHTARLKGYYAELDVLVLSLEGEQSYKVRQWLELPSRWRIEVEFDGGQQVFICDGENVFVYQPGIDEYYRSDAKRAGDIPPPFMLISYLENLPAATDVKYEGKEKKERHTYHIIRYSAAAHGETVKMWLHTKHLFPLYIETFEGGELLNRLTCTRLVLNPDISPELFIFKAPGSKEVSFHCLIRPLSLQEAKKEWPLPLYMPAWLPEGTKLFSVTRSLEEGREQLILVFDGSSSFTLVQREKSKDPVRQTPGLEEISVGKSRGFLQKNSVGELYTLWWANETSEFILSGAAGPEEMVRIAESLRVD